MKQSLFSAIKKFLQWYGGKWTHPLWIFLTLVILSIPCCLLVCCPWKTIFWEILWLSVLSLQFLHLIAAGITGLVLLFRKRIGRAFAYWAECGIFLLVMLLTIIMTTAVSMFIDNDHYADNLKLPTDVILSEPLEGGFTSHFLQKETLTDEFQKAVVESIGSGPTLKPGEECHLPALERLMATEEGKQKVLDYLAASPDWTLRYNTPDRLYATRNSHDLNGMLSTDECHALSPATNAATGTSEGIRAQYSFRIFFDGLPKRLFAKGVKDFDCIIRTNSDTFYADTWLRAGTAHVYIYDESNVPGRQMTATMLALVNKEFEILEGTHDLAAYGERHPQEVLLYNGLQGGMYLLDIWCNPGERGTLSIKATEITQEDSLSEKRLREQLVKTYGCDDQETSFHNQIDFTIYEGNWDQYYGARIELWFKPDSGAPERCIWSENYKIQGWMR